MDLTMDPANSALRGCTDATIIYSPLGNCHRRYKKGEYVRVKVEDSSTRYRKPHLRTPGVCACLPGLSLSALLTGAWEYM